MMFCDIGKFKKYIGTKFLIISQMDEKFAVDSCNNQKDGGKIILYGAQPTNHNQIWTVDCMGHLMNAANPNCVIYTRDTCDSSPLAITGMNENGASPYGPLARWTLTKAGEILCQSNPSQMFNVSGGKMANNAEMIMWHKQDESAKNDKWKIQVVGGFDVAAVQVPEDIGKLKEFVDARFVIKSMGNKKFAVDTASKQRSPSGGDTLIWEYGSGNPNQVFTVDIHGHILSAEKPADMMALVPTKCAQGSTVAMVKLSKTGLLHAPLASWTMNATGEIVNQGNPNLVLNVRGGAIKNGPALILWPRQTTDNMNDKWMIERV